MPSTPWFCADVPTTPAGVDELRACRIRNAQDADCRPAHDTEPFPGDPHNSRRFFRSGVNAKARIVGFADHAVAER
jgi:hypothetical protein